MLLGFGYYAILRLSYPQAEALGWAAISLNSGLQPGVRRLPTDMGFSPSRSRGA